MDYIKSFNKEIEQQRSQNPHNATMKVILRYQKERRKNDFYETMDSLGFMVGVEFTVQNLLTPKFEFVGYLPSIKYHEHNPLSHEPGIFSLVQDEANFKSAEKAYAYAAKEHYYRLMSIPNLENIVFDTN